MAGAGAMVVVATAALIACGDATTAASPDIVIVGFEGGADARFVDGAQVDATRDSVAEAADAGRDAEAGACASLTVLAAGGGQSCRVAGLSSLSCSGEKRYLYECGNPGVRPQIDGCFNDPSSAVANYVSICKPECVRDVGDDFRCAVPGSSSTRAFSCPTNGDGVTLVAVVGISGCEPAKASIETPYGAVVCCN